MNLHISHDNVFMDYIIPIAEEVDPGNNRFVFFSYDQSNELKHVKSKGVSIHPYGSDAFWKDIGDIKSYSNIFIHWLEGLSTDFTVRIPENVNAVWCFWGGDGLEIEQLRKEIYQPKSLEYFRKNKRVIKGLTERLKYRYREGEKERLHLKAIRRVDYFAHYLKEDFQTIKNATGMKATFIPFHYAAVEDIVPMQESMNPKGNSILLGNSDTLSNNHFEAIDKLSQLGKGLPKIYCPLSYERGKYSEDVAGYGTKILGEQFIPIRDFLPKDKYDEILAGTNVSIMNHNRSQALGNIMVLLWKGSKLFMSKVNPIYHLISNAGGVIFSLDDLRSGDLETHLDEPSVKRNREVLMELFGKKKQKEKIRNLLSIRS